MADLSDVEESLAGALIEYFYPNGVGSVSSIGLPVNIFRGLPTSNSLSLNIEADKVDISIYAVGGSARNTTRWGLESVSLVAPPGISCAVTGSSLLFSGNANAGDITGVLVDQRAFVYATKSNDSAAFVAAVLADSIRQYSICWLNGATLTVPGARVLMARIAGAATTIEEYCRQEQSFCISVWASSPQMRDAACSLIGSQFSKISFITLSDGCAGRIRYEKTRSVDTDQASYVFQRDLIYNVEYGTTNSTQMPVALFPELDLNGEVIFA